MNMRKIHRPTLLGDLSALAVSALMLTAPLLASSAAAEQEVHRKHVIKVMTDGAEVIEADVSHLQPGESEVFVTESGSTVDLLRTADGMEIYIDGELVDAAPDEAVLARLHLAEEHVAGEHGEEFTWTEDIDIDCQAEDEETCAELIFLAREGDLEDIHSLAGDHEVRVIRIEKHEEHVVD
jgi:hypothetical protein